MVLLSIYGLLLPFFKEWKMSGGAKGMIAGFTLAKPRIDLQTAFYGFMIGVFVYMMWEASHWNHDARIVPEIVGYFALFVLTVSLFTYTFKTVEYVDPDAPEERVRRSLHLDLTVRGDQSDKKLVAKRAITYMAWLLGFLLSSALIGMVISLVLFVIAYMRVEAKEPWKLTLGCAFGIFIFASVLFDELLALPWPQAEFVDIYVYLKEAALNQYNVWFLK
jgi:hypothetical protein